MDWTWLTDALARVQALMQYTLFTAGATRVTLWSVTYVLVLVWLLFWFTQRVQRWVIDGPVLRQRLDVNRRQVAGTLTRYAMLAVGLLVIVQTAGIDLTTFNVLAGAVGIGIGFGLQNIISNFVAGLIIMFERPIKIGDRVVVGATEGNVVAIGARSTTVLDNDNVTVIVPNSRFITDEVINWSHNDNKVRFRIPVTVAYGSDARLVARLLLEVAHADADVLEEPEPAVRFVGFGDDGIELELRAWSSNLLDRKGRLISQLNFAIYERFGAEGIEFPFPQRDLHIKSGVLNIRRADS
ncbi:MAG: mechanosensitive ion channel [Proteobacteria bacterium]|nr:mechanosensitive ion channel [Pseudomonadota bacterium]